MTGSPHRATSGSGDPAGGAPPDLPPLGAVLAGGESRRYGSPKALAEVGGSRLVDRVVDALRQVTPDLVVSANEPDLFRDLELPILTDERPGLGALGGIHAVLHRARADGRPGILAVACDMPFPCVPLLARLRDLAFGRHAPGRELRRPPDVVVPESRGRRGVEPLFAAYGTGCIAAIEAAIEDGDRRMIGFHDRVRVARVPLAEVDSLCDPDRAFLNVNTPGERAAAESMTDEGGRSR